MEEVLKAFRNSGHYRDMLQDGLLYHIKLWVDEVSPPATAEQIAAALGHN